MKIDLNFQKRQDISTMIRASSFTNNNNNNITINRAHAFTTNNVINNNNTMNRAFQKKQSNEKSFSFNDENVSNTNVNSSF